MPVLEKIAKILVLACLMANQAMAIDSDPTDEFEIKKNYQKERIEDFYQRFNMLEKLDVERRRGENEKRVERKKIAEEYERDRLEHVKLRKEKPIEDPTAFEREIKERQRQHELSRQHFVKSRDEMLRVLKRTGDVPEEDEYDIDLESHEQSQAP